KKRRLIMNEAPPWPKKEEGHIFVDNCSVGTIIKNEAVTRRNNYHAIDSNGKAIVTLGLNSIMDLSFKYPAAQSTIYNQIQRQQLNALYPRSTLLIHILKSCYHL
ncbi:hypothetical protein EDC94DRAFT_520558, partial [Helicostylum pulchrum]